MLRPACLAALATLACAPTLAGDPARADTTDGTLSVTVALDRNGDGSYDPGADGRQPGILVTVADAGGGTVSGTTDGDGRFVVEPSAQLTGGRYFVTAQVPEDLAVIPSVPSDSFAPFSSTVDVSAGSQAVTLGVVAAPPAAPPAATQPSRTADPAPALAPAPAPAAEAEKAPRFAVGDRVWADTDGDGRQGEDEHGRVGVRVQLLGDGGRVLDSTTSDGNGRYLFDDLPAGSYAVRFAGLSSGSKFSPAGAGGGADGNSDPDYTGVTPSFTLDRGERGVRAAEPRDGIRADYVNPTVDAGVAPLRFGIASVVWQDLDADGLLDPAEPAGRAEVQLLRGSDVVARTKTDEQGRYRFSGLSAGSYRVRFTELGAHQVLTRPRVGSTAAVHSAPDPASGSSEPFRLAQGTAGMLPGAEFGDGDADFVLTAVNAGTVGSYRITNRVWRDEDGDGLLGPGEPGVPGVVVELLDAAGDVVATTRTAAGGRFSFDQLPEGQYQLRFPALPPGLHFTTPRVGGDPSADSDVYGNALTGPITVGAAHPVETQVAAGLTTATVATSALASPLTPTDAPPPTPVAGPASVLAGGGGGSQLAVGAVGLLVAAAGAGFVVHGRLRRR
ncbi:hypothetical protein GCM10009616_31250 [Microlunatus lacustris]